MLLLSPVESSLRELSYRHSCATMMSMAMATSATTSLFAASGKCVTTIETRHLWRFKSPLVSLQQQNNLIYLLCSDELTPRRMAMVNKAF